MFINSDNMETNDFASIVLEDSCSFQACFEPSSSPLLNNPIETHLILISNGLKPITDEYGLHSFESNCFSPASKNSKDTLEGLDFDDLASPDSKATTLLSISKKITKKSVDGLKKAALKTINKRNAWTAAEDEKVREFYKIYGPKWTKISSHLPNREGKQVRDRYLNVLATDIKKSCWTEEEDKAILQMLKEIGPQWRKMSKCLEGRTEMQVKNRYYTHLKKHGITFEEQPGTIVSNSTNANSSEDIDREYIYKNRHCIEEDLEEQYSDAYDPIDMFLRQEEESGFSNDIMRMRTSSELFFL